MGESFIRDGLPATLARAAKKHSMFPPGCKVIVGISGGADSTALLHALCELRPFFSCELYAAHVNHCLRGESSDGDEKFARAACESLGVPFFSHRADAAEFAKRESLSIEEAGRRIRYGYFDRLLAETGADKIAVAHTRNDSVETTLLNFVRGSGMLGLRGISPVRGNIVRPLLYATRDQVLEYLDAKKIPYRTDESNADDSYARNRMRNYVIPEIKRNFPEADKAIARAAEILSEEDEYLSIFAREAMQRCLVPDAADDGTPALDVDSLSGFPLSIVRRILREWISLNNARAEDAGGLKNISASHVEAVAGLVSGGSGRVVQLPAKLRVKREYGKLVICRQNDSRARVKNSYALSCDAPVIAESFGLAVRVSFEGTGDNAAGGCTKEFRYDRIRAPLSLRSRLPGDRIYFEGVGEKKLQDYFTDKKIPRDLRDGIPLIADGGEILWILDGAGRVSGRYAPEAGAASVFITVSSLYEYKKGRVALEGNA